MDEESKDTAGPELRCMERRGEEDRIGMRVANNTGSWDWNHPLMELQQGLERQKAPIRIRDDG